MEELVKLMQPKESMSIVLQNDSTDWTTRFSPALNLDPTKTYELALINLETYNSIPNIDEKNNKFVYSDGKYEYLFKLPTGSYELDEINKEVQRQLELSGHWGSNEHYIFIEANVSTLKCIVRITHKDYTVSMVESTLGRTLGFKPTILKKGYHESDLPVNIQTVNSILVNTDVVTGSFVNGSSQPTIYSFFPSAPPGYKIIETPRNLVYLPIAMTGQISNIRLWLTDENGNILNLRGEKINVRLHIRSR